MADLDTADDLDMLEWARAERFDDFALMCCRKPHLSLLSDPDQFSVTQRAGRVGPVLLPRYSSALTYRWRAVICATPTECLC